MRTAKDTLFLFTSNALDALFAFVFINVSFRLLTNDEFGVYSALFNFITVSVSVIDFGIGRALVNFIAYHRHKGSISQTHQYVTAGFVLRVCSSLLFVVAVLLLSDKISYAFFRTTETDLVRWAAISVLALSVLDVICLSFRGFNKFFFSATSSSTYSFIRVLFVGIFFIAGLTYSIKTALVITSFAALAAAGLGFKFLSPLIFLSKPGKIVYRSLASYAGWLGIQRTGNVLAGKLDTQMILLSLGPQLAGIYGLASTVASFYTVPVTSLMAVVAVRLAPKTSWHILRPYLIKTFFVLLCFSAVMLVIAVTAGSFFTVIFGDKARNSVFIFQWYTVALIPTVLSSLPINIIAFFMKKTHLVAGISVLQLGVIVVGNLYLIARVGLYAPIITLAVSGLLALFTSLAILLTGIKRE